MMPAKLFLLHLHLNPKSVRQYKNAGPMLT